MPPMTWRVISARPYPSQGASIAASGSHSPSSTAVPAPGDELITQETTRYVDMGDMFLSYEPRGWDGPTTAELSVYTLARV